MTDKKVTLRAAVFLGKAFIELASSLQNKQPRRDSEKPPALVDFCAQALPATLRPVTM